MAQAITSGESPDACPRTDQRPLHGCSRRSPLQEPGPRPAGRGSGRFDVLGDGLTEELPGLDLHVRVTDLTSQGHLGTDRRA
jgi:hypothetical protein